MTPRKLELILESCEGCPYLTKAMGEAWCKKQPDKGMISHLFDTSTLNELFLSCPLPQKESE